MQKWEYREVVVTVSGFKRGDDVYYANLRSWADVDEGGSKILEEFEGPHAETLAWARTIMARVGKAGWELVSTNMQVMGQPSPWETHRFYFKHLA